MRVEVEELRAALKRLVVAADADRRMVERELHDGVQQHLIALAVDLQLAGQALDSDPAAAKTLLDEMGRDLQHALDETSLLAQRIYPATLEAGGLGTLLRSAAVSAGVPASVDVAAPSTHPPEVVMTLYLCWLNMLARGRVETDARIRVRESEDMLAFEVVGNPLARMRISTTCGTVSRPWVAGWLSPRNLVTAPASPARCRCRDEVSCSPRGRGRRPSPVCGPPAPTSARA